MTSALQKFVKTFVDNRGKIAIVPSEGHVTGIFVPLDKALMDKLSAIARPMSAEDLLEEMARSLALGAGDQVSVTVPRITAAAVYAFASFMAEPQTDSRQKLLQVLMRDIFWRSERKQEES